MKKLVALICALGFTLPAGLASGAEFHWPMFLPAMTTPHCNSTYPELCDNLQDCFYSEGYWYDNKCHQDKETGIVGFFDRIYMIIDGKMTRYKVGNKITYDGILGGTVGEKINGVCYDIPVFETGTGETTISQSPWTASYSPVAPPPKTLPTQLKQTTQFNLNGSTTSSVVDFFQDGEGRVKVIIDPYNPDNPYDPDDIYYDGGYYHNYPDGVVRTESPLYVGKAWSFDYHSLVYSPPYADWDDWTEHEMIEYKGSYRVVGKDVITVGYLWEYEAYKVYYAYRKNGSFWSNGEQGYIWIHPKIGIIKGDVTMTSSIAYGCTDQLELSYSMTGANFKPDNLPYR